MKEPTPEAMEKATSPVRFAITVSLPACAKCGAMRGDPCRAGSGRTMRAHRCRIRALAQRKEKP